MNIRKVIIYVVSVALLVVMTMPSHVSVNAANLSDLQKKSQQLKNEADKLQRQINSQEKTLTNQKVYKATLDKKIANTIQQLDLLEEQIEKLDTQISTLTSDIEAKEALIREKEKVMTDEYASLRTKLRAISRIGNLSSLQMLLSTEEYTDYLIKSKVIECQAKQTEDLIQKIEAEITEINRQKEKTEIDKTAVKKQREEVAILKTEADKQKKELDILYKKSTAVMLQIQKSINEYSQELKATKKEQEAIEREIAKIIAQNSSNARYSGGTMFWPVPAVRNISSYFGPRWETIHKGIDIANGSVPVYGQNIVAAASGKVIYVNTTNSWGYGYGYYLIIDHGKDSRGRTISTLYAHCSKIMVSYGQTVVGGQTVIAKAGATGNVTGPHLHFEVRVNGTAVDPIANGYLRA